MLVLGYVSALALVFLGARRVSYFVGLYKYLPSEAEFYNARVGTKRRNEVFNVVDAFFPLFEYKYVIDGIVYEGCSAKSEEYFIFNEKAKAIDCLEKIIRSRLIYYRPDDPSKSVFFRPKVSLVLNHSAVFFSGILVFIAVFLVDVFVV